MKRASKLFSRWTRREFLGRSAASVAGLSVLRCGSGVAEALDAGFATGDGSNAGRDGDALDLSAGRDGALDASADTLRPTCGELTAPNIEGPFFTPGSPQRADLVEPGVSGTPVRLAGRVLDVNCQPVIGATLDFWQADVSGDYDNVGNLLRGHQFSDDVGGYQLNSILPGRYLNGETFRPSHIHVKVAAPGFALLTTQLYFDGDPFNEVDPFIVESLIVALTDAADGSKQASFDFVVAEV